MRSRHKKFLSELPPPKTPIEALEWRPTASFRRPAATLPGTAERLGLGEPLTVIPRFSLGGALPPVFPPSVMGSGPARAKADRQVLFGIVEAYARMCEVPQQPKASVFASAPPLVGERLESLIACRGIDAARDAGARIEVLSSP